MSVATESSSKPSSSEEFKLDMSSGEKREPTKFDRIADNTLTVLVNHGNTLNELYHLKDELLQYSLPPSFLLQVILLTSRTYRSFSDLNILVKELIRLVQQYSVPWEGKGEVLKKLRDDFESKQRQLKIAVRHLEMLGVEEERMKHERRLNHWMRLYTKTMASKAVGRRWKFRIQPFKNRLAEGYNPYGSESESEEEEQSGQHRLTPSDIEDDELRDLASDRASELSQALSSRLGAAMLKKVQFSGLEETDQPPSSPTGTPPGRGHPSIETCDATTWTGEPEYDYHLLAILYRPKGLLLREFHQKVEERERWFKCFHSSFTEGKDICCTLALGTNFFTSDIYKSEDEEGYQVFRFALTDDEAGYLSVVMKDPEEETDLYSTPKISIAVFPDNIANEMAAHCSVLLPKATLNGKPKVIIPPICNTELIEDNLQNGNKDNFEREQDQLAALQEVIPNVDAKEFPTKLWEPDWEDLISQVMVEDPDPVAYPLKIVQDAALPRESDDEDEAPPPCVPLICQVVKIQRHQHLETGSCTQPMDSLLKNMGYRKLTDVESRAISALFLDPSQATTPDKVQSASEISHVDEEEKMSAEEVAQLTLKHAEELKQLQQQYELKLQTLSRTLARVKSEKQKEIEELEGALLQSEAKNHRTMKTRSPSQLRQMLAQKKKLTKLTKGLPEWGKNIPDNFYERLELFAHESVRKHAEMTEKIKQEVQEVCERQLATLHKLAPNIATNPDSAMDDVCLPALFMPTPTSRPVIYNPRAHSYFHPPGSEDNRVSQPPAIFKLPPVQQGYLSTVNLYELSHDFSKTGPMWLRSDQSPRYTPAPPPSACDYYLPPPNDNKYNQQPKSKPHLLMHETPPPSDNKYHQQPKSKDNL